MFIFLGDFGCRKSIPTPPPISQPKTDNMRTAMQELIDDLRELKKHSKDNKQDTSFDIGMTFAIARAELRLEKEKEQIIEAYEDGKQNGMDSITNIHMYIIGEKYYNQTYKNR
jgi:hypothetical protein